MSRNLTLTRWHGETDLALLDHGSTPELVLGSVLGASAKRRLAWMRPS